MLLPRGDFRFVCDGGWHAGVSGSAAPHPPTHPPTQSTPSSMPTPRALDEKAALDVEAEAFWCFAALMEQLEPNFNSDCT